MSLDEGRIGDLRATAHPLRLRMLSLLTGAELSAAEVARELGTTQANASYHLRVLHSAGLLELAGEESVRGGRAKRYRHVWDAEQPAAESGPDQVSDAVATMAAAVTARFAERQLRSKAVLTDAELWVDPEVWQRALDLVLEASRLVHQEARPPRTAGTIRTSLSVAAFAMDPAARTPPPGEPR